MMGQGVGALGQREQDYFEIIFSVCLFLLLTTRTNQSSQRDKTTYFLSEIKRKKERKEDGKEAKRKRKMTLRCSRGNGKNKKRPSFASLCAGLSHSHQVNPSPRIRTCFALRLLGNSGSSRLFRIHKAAWTRQKFSHLGFLFPK